MGNLNDRNNLEDLGIFTRIILKWTLKKYIGWVWTGFIRLRIGEKLGGGVMSTQHRTSVFHRMWGNLRG
jgi:hypothetical protein